MGANRNTALIHAYVQSLRRRALSPETIKRRRTLLASVGRTLDLADCTADDLEQIIQQRKLVPRSRNAFIADMRGFYAWAVRAGALDRNPVDDMQRSRVPRLRPRPIAEDDLVRAMDAATPRMRLWLVLGAYAGLRCCEIAALANEDLVWHKRPPEMFITGKGGHQRTVPMAEIVQEALSDVPLPRAGFLFPSKSGAEHVAPHSVSQLIGIHLHELGIKASAHMLRHHFGTRVYDESQGDIRLTQEMLGHTSPQTTAIYVGWSTAKAAEVVRTLRPRGPGVSSRRCG